MKKATMILALIMTLEIGLFPLLLNNWQFNVSSGIVLFLSLLLYIEIITCLIFKKHYPITVFLCIIVNIILYSLYYLIIIDSISMFIKLLVVALLLMIFNKSICKLLKLFAYCSLYLYQLTLKPDNKISLITFNASLFILLLSGIVFYFLWYSYINSDYPDDIARQICIHEAGHAVLGELFFPGTVGDIVFYPKVNYELLNIIGIEQISRGFTVHKDRLKYPTKYSIEKQIQVLLAGDLSTKYFFKDKAILGGGSDMPEAFEAAEEYFILTYTDEMGAFNRYKLPPDFEKITKKFVDLQYDKTMDTIKNNDELINIVATQLYKKKTLNSKELQEIMNSYYNARRVILVR